jgi:hypothetical protein
MDLVVKEKEKEKNLLHIEELIEKKRDLLLEKQQKIKKISMENEFLKGVSADYSKYFKHIVSKEQEQVRALKLLNGYIDDLNMSNQLSKERTNEAKKEQQRILDEIDKLKHNIDRIIEKTHD